MMTGVTYDHAQLPAASNEHGRAGHRPSILEQFGRLRSQLQMLEEFIVAFQDELDRLKSDVTNYAQNMRAKVQSLTDQITALQGQVSTAATDQMTADTQSLSDQLDALEQALAQDSSNPPATPPSGGTTPDGGSTGSGSDPNSPAPSARRHH